jgi:hypothetical protein
MTTLREAAQQALEAWEHINKYGFVLADYEGPMEQAITALKAALEQPEQAEPWVKSYCGGKPNYTTPAEQKPVAWIQSNHLQLAQRGPFSCRVEPTQRHPDFVPLYTHPPRREWRGLTEEEIRDGREQLPTEDLCNWSFRKGVEFAEAAIARAEGAV